MKTINHRTKYRIVGSDYSAQEPRMTTFLSGDHAMYDAYLSGKDLYAMIAQSAYHNNYEDNLEFWPEGTELEIDGQKVIAGHKTHLNKDGKARRSVGKVLNLAATYGMSGRTAGIRLGYTGKDAGDKGSELLNNFFGGFPGVRTAIDSSQEFLKKNGYVEDFVGRRRRLTDINLDPYVAEPRIKLAVKANFNPFLLCGDRRASDDPEQIWNQILYGNVILSACWHLSKDMTYKVDGEMSGKAFDDLKKVAANPDKLLDSPSKPDSKWKCKTWREKILYDMQVLAHVLEDGRYMQQRAGEWNLICTFEDNEYNRELYKLINKYKRKYGNNVPTSVPSEPMILMAWTGRIAQASRQCFNARIQGSAATLTKLAMVDIAKDKELNDCQAQLIIPVHDELLVECPAYYADRVEKRLPDVMTGAAKAAGDDVPQSCDPYNVTRWYSDTMAATLLDEEKKLENKGVSREDAFAKVIANHSEIPEKSIMDVLTGKTEETIF